MINQYSNTLPASNLLQHHNVEEKENWQIRFIQLFLMILKQFGLSNITKKNKAVKSVP